MQAINAKNIKTKEKQNEQDPYLFTGLFVCPLCGRLLASARRIRGKQKKYYRYYRCLNHYTNSACDYSRVMNEEVCEDYLVNNIEHLILEKEIAVKTITAENKSAERTINVNDYRKELDRLNNMYQKGRISEEKYDAEYMRISSMIKEYEDNILPFPSVDKSFDKIKQTLSGDWLAIYQSLDRENKRAFWRSIIESIECNVDTGTIKDVNFLI